jgi:hypothetical protein
VFGICQLDHVSSGLPRHPQCGGYQLVGLGNAAL